MPGAPDNLESLNILYIMLVVSGMTGDADGDRSVYVPAYGPVRRIVEYGLFYYVVDRCTRLLVDLFEETSGFEAYVPRLTTASAAALWGMLALVVVLEGRRQYRANPFDVTDLDALRPSRRRMGSAGGATAVGAGAVIHGWPTVTDLITDAGVASTVGREVIARAASPATPAAKTMGILGTEFGVVLAFGAGFVLLAYGFDRLLIGLVREAQYRRHARSV